MACTFEYTHEDAVDQMRLTYRIEPALNRTTTRLRLVWLKTAAIFWITFFGIYYAANRNNGYPPATVATMAAIIATVVVVVMLVLMGASRLMKPRKQSFVEAAIQRYARDGGIRVQPGTFCAEIADGWIRLWSDDSQHALRIAVIDEVVRENGRIYIIIDHTPRMQIPERGFDSPAECEAFCDELRQGPAVASGA